MDGPTATASDTQARAERYAARAQYYRPANTFIVKRPAVPCHRFDAPATTPLILVRYAKVAPNATLTGSFVSSGEQYYVIRGSGDLIKGDDAIPFAADDIVTLPGGGETRIEAGADGAVPTPEDGPMEAALFRASELADELERFRQDVMDDPTRSGLALHMNNAKLGAHYSTHPSIVLAINSLDPHRQQRPHHHNSVAVTMPIRCDRVHSVIDGQRVDWKQYTPMITPPAAMHEHINEGDEMMMSLVVQDGGMHYHLRTIGFGFGDVQAR
ncbi:MAG: hypothetical protein VW644_13075 [Alphaproteobacteria bacterium]